MDLEEIFWGYIPILIAIVEIIISLNIWRKKKNFRNGILTFLIILINGFTLYILIQIFNGAWATYTPHIGIGISTILFLFQWMRKLKN